MIYVAVVAKLENEGLSKRPEGDWAAFIGRGRDATVQRAIKAAKKWGGSYKVLAGQLTEEFAGNVSKPVDWPAELRTGVYVSPPLQDEDIPF